MSKVFNFAMEEIATASGCDWDFVVAMYNHIYDTHGDVDMEQFACGMTNFDWSARGDFRFERVLVDLCEKSGYEYDKLFGIFADMIYDPDDDGTWDYFVGVTMEHDW